MLPALLFKSLALALICYFISFSILGICMVVIFQLAHVTGVQSLPQNPEEQGKDWVLRQVSTTANFAIRNPLLTWCTGGLNYQVEHHLFPTMCHLNYPIIQPVVEKYCHENQLPYFVYKTVFSAIRGHQIHLKMMGNNIVLTKGLMNS